ncbi:hypothetical protein AKO1_007908 [Acrasis kona]|uniref:ABC transporter n=1 Tax=Acrasis kona TaxID=1008807 RepID=A0AAW2YPC3_9EUKA
MLNNQRRNDSLRQSARKDVGQFFALFYKNILLSLVNWKTTLVILLAPLLLLVVLKVGVAVLSQSVGKILSGSEEVRSPPPAKLVEKIPRCTLKGCKSIVYNNDRKNPYIDSIITTVLQLNDLKEDDFVAVGSLEELDAYIKEHYSEPTAVIGFKNITAVATEYSVYFNDAKDTLQVRRFPNYIPNIQQSIDNAIIHLELNASGKAQNYMQAQTRKAPTLKEENGFAIFEKFLTSTIYTMGTTVSIFIALSFFWTVHIFNVCTEKSNNLRFIMSMNGMKSYLYHSSWILHAEILLIITVLILVASGSALKIPIFSNTNPTILMVTYFVVGNVLLSQGYIVISLCSGVKISSKSTHE